MTSGVLNLVLKRLAIAVVASAMELPERDAADQPAPMPLTPATAFLRSPP